MDATGWTPGRIRDLLDRSDIAVEEAVLRLYDRQTADEQTGAVTVHSNGVGFSAFDAELLTSFAQWIQRSTYPRGRRLTVKQMVIARKKMRRYAGQLADIAATKVPSTEMQGELEMAR